MGNGERDEPGASEKGVRTARPQIITRFQTVVPVKLTGGCGDEPSPPLFWKRPGIRAV
jgi:hypothetical protein